MQTTANEAAAVATAAAKSRDSKQLSSAAYWLMVFEQFASAYNTLLALEFKENAKARPNHTVVTAIESGNIACWLQLDTSLKHIISRGALLFVGSPVALARAKAIYGGAA